MEMPSQEEQLIAEKYVLDRPMPRPDTDAKKAAIYGIIYILGSFIIGFVALKLFYWFGIFAYFPEGINVFRDNHNVWFHILFFLSIYLVVGLCCLRMAVIGCIRLYQHYAPEDIRRRCLFKPTCSEYTILAVKKYGVVIGLFKAYIRLFWRCRGNIYSIDYP